MQQHIERIKNHFRCINAQWYESHNNPQWLMMLYIQKKNCIF